MAQQAHDIHFQDTHIRTFTYEIAVLGRCRFSKRSEQLAGKQGLLLKDAVDADITAIEQGLIALDDSAHIVQIAGDLTYTRPPA
ncbi:hypothetical protein H0A73_17235 [Alcaligenaceae bacterium]|nr:hypothetical protein [Alcaligenaceae bacterium]